METEDLAFDDGCQGQIVEQLSEHLPDIRASVLAETFIVESVAKGVRTCFMRLTLE